MAEPVLVTGATGFLGRWVARALAGAGHPVHALARPTSDRSGPGDAVDAWHVGDVTDRASLDRALAAVPGAAPSVVHGAGALGYRRRDRALQRRVHVEGTRHVLDAAAARGARRVVHVGSVVAVGPSRDGRPKDEDAPWEGGRERVAYMDTKRAAEELALGRAASQDVVVVDPGAVFGPGCAGTNSERFLLALAARRLGPFAPPGGMAVVGVRDVAEGIRLALARGRRGARYLLTERDMDALELCRLAAARLGVAPPRARVPRPLWRAVVGLAALVDRVRPLEGATPDALRMLGLSFRHDSSRARRELGWSPRPFDAVLDETVEDLAARDVLPRRSRELPPRR